MATWSDTGAVHIWNLRTLIRSLDVPPTQRLAPINPEFTFKGHRTEARPHSLCLYFLLIL